MNTDICPRFLKIRNLHDRLNKISDELDHKSKVLQQYMLREYASKLQPDDKTAKASVNMNVLSSASAMQRMDPILLSQVNMKMQKLLEVRKQDVYRFTALNNMKPNYCH
jgi:hypothetical protein